MGLGPSPNSFLDLYLSFGLFQNIYKVIPLLGWLKCNLSHLQRLCSLRSWIKSTGDHIEVSKGRTEDFSFKAARYEVGFGMCLPILEGDHSLLELRTLSGQPGPKSAATSPDPLICLLYKYLPWAKMIQKVLSQTTLSLLQQCHEGDRGEPVLGPVYFHPLSYSIWTGETEEKAQAMVMGVRNSPVCQREMLR